LPLLEKGKDWADSASIAENFPVEAIEQAHYRVWKVAKEIHQQENLQIINLKKESLEISHKARIALLKEQLDFADNEKIIRMRKGQLVVAENDFDFRLRQLNEAETKADIIADVVVYGIIKIEN
jgi:hypothetical protein